MFGFEDMTTDSTSVLKDFRHPSVSSVNVGPSIQTGPKLGRVVSLNRSVSSAGHRVRRQSSSIRVSKRPRYLSESNDRRHSSQQDGLYGSKLFICTTNNDVRKQMGSSLCVSMDVGLAGAPTPLIMEPVEDLTDPVKTGAATKANNLAVSNKCYRIPSGTKGSNKHKVKLDEIA